MNQHNHERGKQVGETGAFSFMGVVISILLFVAGCAFGVPAMVLFCSVIGLPDGLKAVLMFSTPFLVVLFFWWQPWRTNKKK
jgi:hypothetical protein